MDGFGWALAALFATAVAAMIVIPLGFAVLTSLIVGIAAASRAFVSFLALPLPANWRRWLVERGVAESIA